MSGRYLSDIKYEEIHTNITNTLDRKQIEKLSQTLAVESGITLATTQEEFPPMELWEYIVISYLVFVAVMFPFICICCYGGWLGFSGG